MNRYPIDLKCAITPTQRYYPRRRASDDAQFVLFVRDRLTAPGYVKRTSIDTISVGIRRFVWKSGGG